MKTIKKKKSVYEIVTQKIIEQLENKVIPWKQPWNTQGFWPCNLISKRPYHGINVFLLAIQGYNNSYWVTYKQARENGGYVKKGEKSTIVVYWNFIEVPKKKDEIFKNESIEDIEDKEVIPFLRYYNVFNISQIEGLGSLIPEEESKQINFNPIKKCEDILKKYKDKPEIKFEGTRCFYNPAKDFVNIVDPDRFDSPELYYATFFHELIHSTGHKNRLNRKIRDNFNDMGEYGMEELVAEMGTSFLCNIAGISGETIDNTVGYIDGWLKQIRKNPKIVVFAASKAQKAVDYILGYKGV